MTIFEKVKEISLNKGMSLQEVATKAGLGINAIYSWKTKNPSINNVILVAKALNTSVDNLVSDLKETTDFGSKDDSKPVGNEKTEDQYVAYAQAFLMGLQFTNFVQENKLTEDEQQDLMEEILDYIDIRARRIVKRRATRAQAATESKEHQDYAMFHLAKYFKIAKDNDFNSRERKIFLEEATRYLEIRASQIINQRVN